MLNLIFLREQLLTAAIALRARDWGQTNICDITIQVHHPTFSLSHRDVPTTEARSICNHPVTSMT